MSTKLAQTGTASAVPLRGLPIAGELNLFVVILETGEAIRCLVSIGERGKKIICSSLCLLVRY
jgi:hypothetical protein